MRSTLFFIPHEFLGIPLFGFGWALGLTVLAFIGWMIFQIRSGNSSAEVFSSSSVWIVAVVLLVFVLPSIEQRWRDGTPIGLPIRGYGVMVLTGMLTGIALTSYRANRLGVSPDTIIGLGVWSVLGGVLGARLFFVVQKWETFPGQGVERWISILKLTEGGLVIYGGIIGGLAAGAIYCYRHKLPVLATGDLVVPGFLLGYTFGRLGCLLHGCCFGGICDAPLPTIQFPAGSLPYQAQVQTGRLLGMHLAGPYLPSIVESVDPGSAADLAGVRKGDQLRRIDQYQIESDKSSSPAAPTPVFVELDMDNATRRIDPAMMPTVSLPVHPSQLYSALNALLLGLLMWLWQPLPKRDGVIFLSAVILYAIARFLIELIRSDESGQFGTELTIAQVVSLVCGSASILGLLYLATRPPSRHWPWSRCLS